MHNIEYRTYDENVDRRKVEAELNDFVAHEDWQEGASGLPNRIIWKGGGVFDDYDAAVRHIEAEDQKRWYNCMAVKYCEYGQPKATAKIQKLEAAVKEQTAAVQKIREDASIKNRKSEFIGCPNCKSSLKRELLHTDLCPLCRTDLRSETNLERIRKAEMKRKSLQNELDLEREHQARKNKPKVKWLVKIEYHT